MIIIGIDYHPSFQQIAFVDQRTGECGERQLNHSDGEAERFYRELKQPGVSVLVGMEATGHSRWFERLLTELGFELWIGDPAEIKAERVRKQKNDREDARLLLKLLLEKRFPRIWVPSPENRDLRQMLWHRHRLVQMRTRIMNQLQAVAMNEGYRWKKKLFSEKGRGLLEKLGTASKSSCKSGSQMVHCRGTRLWANLRTMSLRVRGVERQTNLRTYLQQLKLSSRSLNRNSKTSSPLGSSKTYKTSPAIEISGRTPLDSGSGLGASSCGMKSMLSRSESPLGQRSRSPDGGNSGDVAVGLTLRRH